MIETVSRWTEDELAALPQIDRVFDRPVMNFDDHKWLQQGSYITDVCSPARPDCHFVGIPVPDGKMLEIVNGKYRFITEEESREMRTSGKKSK